jgi:hypothetical protein
MDASISRRDLLRFGATCVAIYSTGFGRKIMAEADTIHKRPFDWNDALRRWELESVAISPNRGIVAVQVTRPLNAPGPHAGWPQRAVIPRGDIWLLDENLASPKHLTLNDQWLWAPAFSPNGHKLAALTSKADGRVGFVVWDLTQDTFSEWSSFSVDLYTKFASEPILQSGLPAVWAPYSQYAWVDDKNLIFVAHGGELPQFEQSIEDASGTYAGLRGRTQRGEVSVRVWNASSPTCGQENKLSILDCSNGDLRCIYEGDVRGVSLSPDRKWAAALIAQRHINPPPNRTMQPSLRWTSEGDDPLVALGLARVDLFAQTGTTLVREFNGVGNVSPLRLPVWNHDSTKFAVPARTIYSSAYSTSNDSCWEIEAENLHIRKWQAHSALDAELLAQLLVCMPESRKQDVILQRPTGSPVGNDIPIGGGQIEGAAWRYGKCHVALWIKPTITLIGPEDVFRVPEHYTTAYAPVSRGTRASMYAVGITGQSHQIFLDELNVQIRKDVLGAGWVYMGTRPNDATLVAKRDSDSGTGIAGFSAAGPAIISPLKFNEHFGEIERSKQREITRRTISGKSVAGILQLPIGRSPNDRHPVIIWAYPDQTPSINDSMTRINSTYAISFPLQYLLTRGFAVFHAPLSTVGKHIGEPYKMVTEAVMPWLDVLDQQPELISGEYGFYGHSNAGYVGLALEGITARFKCIVASSTFPDLGARNLSASLDKVALDCAGQVIQADRRYYEDVDQPYTFGAPIWKAEHQVIENSPIHRLGSATTPLLLIEGEFDASPREMEAVFSILYGRGVPVELAYYWGETHIINSPGNIKDIWQRTEAFFRRYLRTH